MANLFTKLEPKHRWVQVSLRTVLGLVALLCIALSLWVVPLERQRRAVTAIEELGGSVGYVDHAASEAFPVTWLRHWLPRDYFDGIELVRLGNTQVTDAGLAYLQGRTSLLTIDLGSTQVTDAGLAHLQGLKGLQTLWLDNTQVTDTGLAHLRGLMELQVLSLTNAHVTDAGLAHLQGLTGLQVLYLTNTLVTNAGLTHLQGLPGLRGLWLDKTQVTDDGLGQLRKALPNYATIVGP